MAANTPIHSITPFTTLDYPNYLACIFWFAKCNMACPYCYNPQIVRASGAISLNEALAFLEKRAGRLDGVVLSGGECTLYQGLPAFCDAIHALGFKIKLDTNGSNPQMLETLLACKRVDYVAMDYKAPLDAYPSLTHFHHPEAIQKSLSLLLSYPIPFEVRTTWHGDLLSVAAINTLIEELYDGGYRGTYYLQHYLHVDTTLGATNEEYLQPNISQLSSLLPIELRNF